jgi:chromosome segregation ATPase
MIGSLQTEQQIDRDGYQTAMTLIREELEQLKTKNSFLSAQLQEKDKKLKQLDTLNAKLMTVNAKITSEHELEKSSNADLRKKLKTCEEECAVLARELSKRNQGTGAQHNEYRSKFEEVQKKNRELTQLNVLLGSEILFLRKQVQTLQTEIASKDVIANVEPVKVDTQSKLIQTELEPLQLITSESPQSEQENPLVESEEIEETDVILQITPPSPPPSTKQEDTYLTPRRPTKRDSKSAPKVLSKRPRCDSPFSKSLSPGRSTKLASENTQTTGSYSAKAIFSYRAKSSREISLEKNEVIQVIDKTLPSSWIGINSKQEIGSFPTHCVKMIK